jgi:iron-sulfur cluster repair protein YtfE (RIC family)
VRNVSRAALTWQYPETGAVAALAILTGDRGASLCCGGEGRMRSAARKSTGRAMATIIREKRREVEEQQRVWWQIAGRMRCLGSHCRYDWHRRLHSSLS